MLIDKKGVSTIAVVLILVIAVVAVAGAYLLLKDDNNNNDNDGGDGNDGGDSGIDGKMGVGTILYYDETPNLASVSTTSSAIGVTGELIGESESNYFFEYGKGTNKYLMVETNKKTGAIGSAVEKNGKWTIEITGEDGIVTKAEMTIGSLGDYGNVISTISVTFNGQKVFSAEVRSSGHDIVDPTEYKPSEYSGKYQKYSMDLNLTATDGSETYTMKVGGYSKATVVGTAADGMLIVLVEGEMNTESNVPEETADMEYSFREYVEVSDIQEQVPEWPDGLVEYVGTETITVANMTAQAKKYTIASNIEGVDVSGTMHVSMDDKILYRIILEGEATDSDMTGSITMKIEYAEGNL
jgi:copper chaperone CopZ